MKYGRTRRYHKNTQHSGTITSNKMAIPLGEEKVLFNLQVGANSKQQMTIIYDSLDKYKLKIANTHLLSYEESNDALEKIDYAIDFISKQRSQFGAYQNRLEHTIKNVDNTELNLQDAESKIRDTDMAEGVVNDAKNKILQDVIQAMLANANSSGDAVLSLLRQG